MLNRGAVGPEARAAARQTELRLLGQLVIQHDVVAVQAPLGDPPAGLEMPRLIEGEPGYRGPGVVGLKVACTSAPAI